MDLLDESGLTPGWLIGFVPELKLCASFAVKGTFQLKSGGAAELAPKQDDLEGDLPEHETSKALTYTRDLTPLKARVDLLLAGKAFAPGGKPTDMLPVTFKVGGWSKTLAVIGDRTQTQGLFASSLSAPGTFTEMPLTWARAYGGIDFPSNPEGRGRDGEKDAKQKEFFRQPNVVRMEEAGYGSSNLKEPAGFGPLSPEWPQRAKLAERGTYGSKWLKDTWPAPPRDFDISYFNAAPLDQQLPPGTLRGDEPLEFFNLHPEKQKFESRLPGVRPRFFVLEAPPTSEGKKAEQFREVNLQIDTLWVDPSKEKLILVWRGLHPVRSKGMKEISAIVIGREPMDRPPLPARHYHDLLIRKQKEREEKKNAPPPPPPVIAPVAIEMPKFDWAAWEKEHQQKEQDKLKELDRISKETLEETKRPAAEALQKEGLSPAILDTVHPTDPASVAAQFAKDHAALARMNPSAAEHMLPPPTAAQLDVDAIVKKEFDDFQKEFAKPVVPLKGPAAPPSAEEKPQGEAEDAEAGWTRERVERQAARKEKFLRLDLRGLDLSGIVLPQARFEGCVLGRCNLSGADLQGASFTQCTFAEANLGKANLAGASFRFCDLAKANLSEAVLAKAVLDDSDLSGAKLAKAKLEETSACRATFAGVAFTETVIRQCNFTGADFIGATVAGVSLGQSILKGVNAYEMKAAGARFEKCDLTNFRAGDGADFTGAAFTGVRAPSSVWEGVVLDKANFLDADLTRASFAGSSLQESKFGRANLSKARLLEADLTRAEFQRSNLFRGSLEGATLTAADFRGANLYEVEFLDSVRDQALFDAANLKGTKLG